MSLFEYEDDDDDEDDDDIDYDDDIDDDDDDDIDYDDDDNDDYLYNINCRCFNMSWVGSLTINMIYDTCSRAIAWWLKALFVKKVTSNLDDSDDDD